MSSSPAAPTAPVPGQHRARGTAGASVVPQTSVLIPVRFQARRIIVAERLLQIATATVVIVALLVGYLALIEWLLSRLQQRAQTKLRPWLWLLPALVLVTV